MDTIVIHVTAEEAHPLNGRPQMTLDIRNTNPDLKTILYAAAESGTVHAWNTRLTVYGIGNWGYGFTAPLSGYVLGDRNNGIGHPGVTSSVITTAAHETNFTLTAFSSYGPRMDDVMKPDISAPGYQIISSFNSFSATNFTPVTTTMFQGREYEFVRLSGTSMSAPMVTGVVALLLEADPTLSAHDVKQILTENAREDNLTGTLPIQGHPRWGHGKLDALNALQGLGNTAVSDQREPGFSIFPNPAGDILYTDKVLTGRESFRLMSLDGRLARQGAFQGQVSLQDVRPGLYILQVVDGLQVWSTRLSVLD